MEEWAFILFYSNKKFDLIKLICQSYGIYRMYLKNQNENKIILGIVNLGRIMLI